MKINRQKLIKHLEMGLGACEGAGIDMVTIMKSDAKTALALLKTEETPHKIDMTDDMKEYLGKMTGEERLDFIRSLTFDWDGFGTADNLGHLINEIYTYAAYPTKETLSTRYKKKPVEIDAIKFFGDFGEHRIIPDWLQDALNNKTVECDEFGNCVIHTLEGEMKVSINDFIIRGVQGELYPCKPDIFEQTYDKVIE